MFRGRPVTDGQPTWTDDDRLWAKAWQYNEQRQLPCGCDPEDVVGIEHDDAYVAEPVVCHRHRAIGEAAEARQRTSTEADVRHGLLWRTRRVD